MEEFLFLVSFFFSQNYLDLTLDLALLLADDAVALQDGVHRHLVRQQEGRRFHHRRRLHAQLNDVEKMDSIFKKMLLKISRQENKERS